MKEWLEANWDYLAFSAASVLAFALLDLALRRRQPPTRLTWQTWPILAFILGLGWFTVKWDGHRERAPIEEFMKLVAPTYAVELERMGHAKLTLDTPPDDPNYLAMIEAEKRWLKVNPDIADIYTHRRRPDGKVVLMVDSETDYNHDGKYDGPHEARTPLGEVYDHVDQSLLDAFDGQIGFTTAPIHDDWGTWVSAMIPMRDEAGKVEAVLGVDYPAASWIAANARGRLRGMALLALPLLGLAAASGLISFMRAELRTRRKIADDLTESEARLRAAIDNMPFEVWAMDAAGHYTLGNPVVERTWGRNLGQSLADVDVHPDVRAHWAESNRRAFAGETATGEVTYVVRGRRRNYFFVVAPIRVGDKITGIIGVNLDITDRVQAENARRLSEQRLALHVRQTPLGVIEWDLNHRITSWNPAAERIFGFTAAETVGRCGFELLVPPSARKHVDEIWAAILANKGGFRSTNENLTKDGRTIICEWYNTPLVDDHGEVIGAASLAQDVSERDALERQLRQAQKMESIGQLAGGVAHEFNNLLTPMLIQTDQIEIEYARDRRLLQLLRPIQEAIVQAAQLNQRILAVGRRSPEERQFLPLNDMVENAVALLRPGFDHRIELGLSLAPGLPPLWLDRSQVTQIVMNLALNARDTLLDKVGHGAPLGWRPRLTIATARLDAVKPVALGGAAVPAIPCQRLTVTDNGLGIPAGVRTRIFEPFYTTKEPGKGTGLGLAVVWNVVQNLAGWIEITDGPHSEGTTFHVYFPMPLQTESDPLATATAPAVMAPPAKREPLRVLLVEDNALVSNTLIALLSSAGHAVVSAQNGEEGWDIFSRRSGQFDLVLADYNMPRLNGADLARRVRAANFPGRFILVSGFLTSEKVEELKNIGVDMTLNKPISSAALLAALDPAATAN